MSESWYLKIDGIEGESSASGHKGEIDISAWSWGVSATGQNQQGGGGAGKAEFQDFHFVTAISKASPALFLACATGTHIKTASLSGVRGAGKVKATPFLQYKLSDVTVSSVDWSEDGGEAPAEQFSLSYGKFEVIYTPQSPSGQTQPPVRAGYDLKLNKAF